MDGADLIIPGDALRQVDLLTLAQWNAAAREQGRTAFQSEGVDVIDPGEPVLAYAAYVLGETEPSTEFGVEKVPGDLWLLVACMVMERKKGRRGRVLEVRASAFRSAPLAEPSPDIIALLFDGAERFRAKRERLGCPLGVSLFGTPGSDS